jgi:toxin ParE1/3/4
VGDYRLTLRAEADVFEIFLYGLEALGSIQARRYKDDLARCFVTLAENPRMGRPAEAVAPGLRRHEHQSHVIFYEIDGPDILIIAVVHGRSIRRLEL